MFTTFLHCERYWDTEISNTSSLVLKEFVMLPIREISEQNALALCGNRYLLMHEVIYMIEKEIS